MLAPVHLPSHRHSLLILVRGDTHQGVRKVSNPNNNHSTCGLKTIVIDPCQPSCEVLY